MRFPYTYQWNSDTLNNLCRFYKGNGLSKNDISDDGICCILYGQLYTTYSVEVITSIFSKTNTKLDNPFYSKINDLIIPSSGEDPIEIAVARSVQVQNVILGGDLNVLRPIDKIDSKFLSYQLNGKRKADIAKVAQGKSIVHLHNNDLKRIKVYFPDIEEQSKISTLLFKLDKRIETQNKIINDLVLQKKLIAESIFKSMQNLRWKKLFSLEKDGIITLKRGNIIPKHIYNAEYCYPVYSSSIHNDGLMGYSNSFMFNKELVTWSIDGGGNFFYRNKHKFNVTNVSGILELNNNIYDYYFVAEILEYQHSKFIFDYQTKAHPSVIGKMYSLPEVSLDEQKRIVNILNKINRKLQAERDLLTCYKKQKAYLLKNMFI